MKKITLSFLFLFICNAFLYAQVTQEQADTIVQERMINETRPFTLYAEDIVQTDYTVLTSANEKIKLNYTCRVYYANFTEETTGKYLIVKESNGNVLEVNAKNDEGPEDLEDWRVVPNIPHSVWKCIKAHSWDPFPPSYPVLDLSFYPSLGKLIVVSDITNSDGTPWTGIYDYFIDESGILYWIPDIFLGSKWRIFYKSDTEMRLLFGNMNPLSFYFVCLTEFNEI